MKTFVIQWNHTDRGHHMKPDSNVKDLAFGEAQSKLRELIDFHSRTCRIWLDGELVWYYDSPLTKGVGTEEVIALILKEPKP